MDRAAGWLNAHPAFCVAALSLAYWFAVLRRAAFQILSLDEITTLRISHLESVRVMWQALTAGCDQHVIGTHLLVRWSQALFGDSQMASRLPSALGGWILFLCIYALLRPRVPAVYALAGALLPWLTFIWQFNYQARSYGVLLGATALALLCWTKAGEGGPRLLLLAGISLGFFVALTHNMAAVVIALPFAAGEIARSVERRRIDYPVWIAFALPAPAVLLYPPILAGAHDFNLRNLYPQLDAIPAFYTEMVQITVLPLIVAAIAAWLVARDLSGPSAKPASLPKPLLVSCMTFLFLPALWIVFSWATRSFVFSTRYGVFAVLGLAPLLTAAAAWIFSSDKRAGAAILLTLSAFFLVARVRPAIHPGPAPAEQFADSASLLLPARDLPVVVADAVSYYQADTYLPLPAARRLVFLVDFENSWRQLGGDILHKIIWRQQPFQKSPRCGVAMYREFLAQHPSFYLWTTDTPPEAIYFALQRDRRTITLAERTGGQYLFLVSSPGAR